MSRLTPASGLPGTPAILPLPPETLPPSVAAAVATATPGGAVPVESPLALFVPDRRLHGLQPVSVFLPALVPGVTGTGNYARTPSGYIAREEDRVLRHQVQLGGTRVDVVVEGSQQHGLVTMFDWDFLLGMFTLAERGHARDDGFFRDVSWSLLCEAAGRRDLSGETLAGAKRALHRWSGIRIVTRLDVEADAALGAADAYQSRARTWPSLLEREGSYAVTQMEFTAAKSGGSRSTAASMETLGLLWLNPLWLLHARLGHTAWLNVRLHCALRRATSKRLLQAGTLAVVRGDWRPGEVWEMPLATAAELIGVQYPFPAKQRAAVAAACDDLVAEGALQYEIVPEPGRRRDHLVRLSLGPEFLAADYYRAVNPAHPPALRALMWHLTALGVKEPEAAAWIREDAAAVRDALRYAYWLRAVHGGRTSPTGKEVVRHWGAFLKRALAERWAYSYPEFQTWVRDVAAGDMSVPSEAWPVATTLRAFERPAVAPRVAIGPRENSAAAAAPNPVDTSSPTSSDDTGAAGATPLGVIEEAWVRTTALLIEREGALAVAWLEGTTAEADTDDAPTMTVEARDDFAARWIATKLRVQLEELLGEVRGIATRLVVRGPSGVA